jgi:hypothetical protein
MKTPTPSKTLVYPFAIIIAGALYVSYRHKLRHKHLLKSIHKFSTSYPMNNIPFLEIKLFLAILGIKWYVSGYPKGLGL